LLSGNTLSQKRPEEGDNGVRREEGPSSRIVFKRLRGEIPGSPSAGWGCDLQTGKEFRGHEGRDLGREARKNGDETMPSLELKERVGSF